MDRRNLRDALAAALEPHDFVRAAWEAGSASFGNDDEYSDIDLQVLADDAHKEQVFQIVYDTVEDATGIDRLWRLPDPTWHGHPQAFIRPAGVPEHLLIDLVVMAADAEDTFLQAEVHGHPVVFFDKDGVVSPAPWDREAARERMLERLANRRIEVDMFGHSADKSASRGNLAGALDALRFWSLWPLHEAIRMKHVPDRWDWSTQYVRRDLPADVADRYDRLWAVNTVEGIPAARAEAAAWFRELADEVESREAGRG